jgi:hypothetical protein
LRDFQIAANFPGRQFGDLPLARRVEMLMTIPAVGQATAPTWALAIGEPAPPIATGGGR